MDEPNFRPNQRKKVVNLSLRIKESLASLRAEIQEVAGPYYRGMMASPAVAERFLRHPDPRLQWAALNILGQHWGIRNQRLGPICEAIIKVESDTKLLLLAMSKFSRLYEKSRNRSAARLLAKIVSNEIFETKVRTFAYTDLLKVWGNFVVPSPIHFQFPAEVKWSLVQRILDDE